MTRPFAVTRADNILVFTMQHRGSYDSLCLPQQSGGRGEGRTTYLDQQLRSSGGDQVRCSAASAHVIPYNVSQTHRRGGTRRNHSRHYTDSNSSEAAGRRHHSPRHWHHRGAQAFTFPCSARGSRRLWVPVSWDVVLVAREADSRALSQH